MTEYTPQQLFSETDGREPDWSQFDALELHGATRVEMGDGGNAIETDPVNSADVELYCILAHYKTGGTCSITDVERYDDAVEILGILSRRAGLWERNHAIEPARPKP